MVRERSPSKAPLVPTATMSQPIVPGETPQPSSENVGPKFGVPSSLPTVPPSFSTRPKQGRPAPQAPQAPQAPVPSSEDLLFQPATNNSFHHQSQSHFQPPPPPPAPKIYRPAEKSGSVFIQPKRPYKPPTNPLMQARNTMDRPQVPLSKPQPMPSMQNDESPIMIPAPYTQPSFGARPAQPPMFSSQPLKARPISNFIDLTTDVIGMATNGGLFHDGHNSMEPGMYMDSRKANDDIKALLEGAFEDEDDKPRTRRGKQKKLDELTAKLGDLHVKGTKDDEKATEEAQESDEEEVDDGSRPGLKVKLLPHQIEGLDWMYDKEVGLKKTRGVFPKGGILADDMGLGKTIQSIALILKNPHSATLEADGAEQQKSKRKLPSDLDKGTLVVAPLALIKQWEGELRDRVEDSHTLSVCVHHGPQRAKHFKTLKKYDIVITTYHTLVSEHGSSSTAPDGVKTGCFGLNWYRVILDEAHSIKNRNAKATKAACALNAQYRWCLTGTPVQNNLDELQSLIHFLRIKPYMDLNEWRDQITRPMKEGRGGLAVRRLQVYLKAFMKRRTKDILRKEGALTGGGTSKDDGQKSNGFKLVKRTVETISADFTQDERRFYNRLESKADKSLERMMVSAHKITYASALVLLLRLRQACNHPDLIKGELAKEKDAFAESQSSSQKSVGDADIDSMAALLGGLTMQSKRCDICQTELSSRESQAGASRCAECEEDLEFERSRQVLVKGKQNGRSKKVSEPERVEKRAAPNRRRKIITDSDDEDDEDGSNNQRPEESDENQENIQASDSEDGDIRPSGRRRKAQKDEYENTDEEEAEEEDDDVEDTASDISAEASPCPVISTKIRRLLRLLRADSHDHKYIIFSFFTSMLDLIEPFLRRDGLMYTRYDGSMKNDHREASLEKLRTHGKTRILLCSLRAGSLGLNLTAASRVVILEPFWNPFVEEQAIDRVHRLNQTRDVIVYKMTIKDSVEERILELQDRKRELANATIEGKMEATKLTMQDMLKLFRREAESEHQVDGLGMGLLGGGRRDGGGLTERGDLGESTRERERERGGDRGKPKWQGSGRQDHEVYGRRW